MLSIYIIGYETQCPHPLSLREVREGRERGKREREEKEEKQRGQSEFNTQEKKGPHRGPRFSCTICS